MAGIARGKIIVGDASGDPSYLSAGANGKILVADANGDPSWSTMGGGATISGSTLTLASSIDATKIANGTVTSTEFQYINTLSSNAQTQISAKAPLASPTFTGVPSAPTISPGTSTTQLATTAFVVATSGYLAGDNVFTSTTASSSKTTGAMRIAGGVGILLDLNVGGDITAHQTSDKRLKTNITKIDSPLEKLDKINGYTFDWIPKEGIHSYTGRDVGVIAQEIEEVCPETTTTRENGYKAVRYEKIVPLLIECIKEQQKQIDELKNKV
jgi:hypothetical protein